MSKEIERRRTFAIISHPDAGKTTLTEKFLLFGGQIQVAGAVKSNKTDIVELLSEIVVEAKVMLDKTPDLLPALKKAKVVDSGGMGLYIILQGMYDALKDGIKAEIKDISAKGSAGASGEATEDIDIKFGYCTEFIMLGDASKAKSFQDEIEPLGDSMIVVGYDDVIKVHIHTNNPGEDREKMTTKLKMNKLKF